MASLGESGRDMSLGLVLSHGGDTKAGVLDDEEEGKTDWAGIEDICSAGEEIDA